MPLRLSQEDPQMRWLSLRQNSLLRQPVAALRFRRNEVLMLLQVRKWMGWVEMDCFNERTWDLDVFGCVVTIALVVVIVVHCVSGIQV